MSRRRPAHLRLDCAASKNAAVSSSKSPSGGIAANRSASSTRSPDVVLHADSPARQHFIKRAGSSGWRVLGERYKRAHRTDGSGTLLTTLPGGLFEALGVCKAKAPQSSESPTTSEIDFLTSQFYAHINQWATGAGVGTWEGLGERNRLSASGEGRTKKADNSGSCKTRKFVEEGTPLSRCESGGGDRWGENEINTMVWIFEREDRWLAAARRTKPVLAKHLPCKPCA